MISTDTLLKTQESVQDTLVKEESIGHARAEEQLSSEKAEAYRRQMGDKFCAMVVSNFVSCIVKGRKQSEKFPPNG